MLARLLSPPLLCAAAAAAAVSSAAAQPADLVVVNAAIWTGDAANPQANALAVRDGRFVAVGEEARNFIGPDTRVIDAEGARVVPGLMDTHVHIVSAAVSLGRLDLRSATSREDLLQRLRDHAQRLGPNEWVLGRGWSAESWPDPTPPTAEEIDEAVGGRPALLTRMDGHSLLASATALRLAGIDEKGPADPPGGKIGRFKDGRPDGALYEAAMGLVARLAPEEDPARVRRLLKRAFRECNRYGITQIGAIESRRGVESFLAPMDRTGELTVRVAATISGGGDTLESWRPLLVWAQSHRQLSPHVRVLGFKGYMDGSLGSRTAWMDEPFADDPRDPNNAGFPLAMAANGELRRIIHHAAEMGLQPAVHAIGDKANSVLLDWYAELPQSVRQQVRPRIEHAQHLLPRDVARFGALGVIPSMQPYHKADDGRYALSRLGSDRVKTSYAFRQLLDTGAALAFGSDWPVVSVNPWLGVHAAVSARTLDGKIFVPEQSITVEEALRAYTSGAAFCLHSEQETGAIRTGLRADFAILSQDPLRVPVEAIPATEATLTVMDGRVVYEAEKP